MFLIGVLIFIITIVFAFWLYVKLTCGVCKCSRHLLGKVVIITGANRGIGFETAKDLANRGAKVILACRSDTLGKEAKDKIIAESGNEDVHYQQLDLASLTSVRNFANKILTKEKRLDILINNAGVLGVENTKTEDGLSLVMQANHFGHFLLTNLLLPLLKSSAPSRIINVTSVGYKMGEIDFNNLNAENEELGMFKIYFNSKLCNVLFTVELAKRLEGSGVTVNCLHPGNVETDIAKNKLLPLPRAFRIFVKNEWEGAQTSIYLAVSPEVIETSGSYFSDCQKRTISKLARDTELAQKLWHVSEHLVKLK